MNRGDTHPKLFHRGHSATLSAMSPFRPRLQYSDDCIPGPLFVGYPTMNCLAILKSESTIYALVPRPRIPSVKLNVSSGSYAPPSRNISVWHGSLSRLRSAP